MRLAAANRLCFRAEPSSGGRERRRLLSWRASVAMLTLLGLAASPAPSQAVISIQAGLLNYTEGTVLLNDRPVSPAAGKFQQMGRQDVLRTSEAGRAEVLLSPGVFMRGGHASEVRLDSDRIDDARVALISGTLLVEAAQIPKGSRVTFACRDATVSLEKSGIYRLQADPALLRVRSGRPWRKWAERCGSQAARWPRSTAAAPSQSSTRKSRTPGTYGAGRAARGWRRRVLPLSEPAETPRGYHHRAIGFITRKPGHTPSSHLVRWLLARTATITTGTRVPFRLRTIPGIRYHHPASPRPTPSASHPVRPPEAAEARPHSSGPASRPSPRLRIPGLFVPGCIL